MREQRIRNLLAGNIVAKNEIFVGNRRLIFQANVCSVIIGSLDIHVMRRRVEPVNRHTGINR